MPPKSKGDGGKKKKSEGYVIDGVSTLEMTREQLETFAHRLKEETEREREERNFFQLERDKLRTFWEITRQQLEENRAELRNKDREIEEAEQKHKEEIKYLKQKVKHLQYEHQKNLSELKAEEMVALKHAQDDYSEQELELLKDKRDLKLKLKEQEVAQQEQMKQLRLAHSEAISEARAQFEQLVHDIEAKYEAKRVKQRNYMTLRHRMELSEVQERKNKQLSELMKNHEATYRQMKDYYNDITLNNLALITSLKDQMENMKKKEQQMMRSLNDVEAENSKLIEPLEHATTEVSELRRRMTNYEKDKMSLTNTKTRLNLCQKELENLKWENEVLKLRFEKVCEKKKKHCLFSRSLHEAHFHKDSIECSAKNTADWKTAKMEEEGNSAMEAAQSLVSRQNEHQQIHLKHLVSAHNCIALVCGSQLHDLQEERDELRGRFVTAILELQQKTGLKNVLLEKKLAALEDLLEQKEAQISEVLAASHLEPSAMARVNKKLEELLCRKNAALQDLQYELARVCKAHDDLLQTYEGKLQQFGIPKEELGFSPLQISMGHAPQVGRGPAGLVTLNP